MKEQKIKVLWIDDQSKDEEGNLTRLGIDFTDFVEEEGGIDLIVESSFTKGVEKIRRNPKEFLAVILDIRNERVTEGKVAEDSTKAEKEIERLQIENGQQEPYIFFLSADKKYQKNEDGRYLQPLYRRKAVYAKTGDDYKLLVENIKEVGNISSYYSTREGYKDVLETTQELVGDEAQTDLFKLIHTIVTKNESRDANQFNAMRKFLETYIMSILKENKYPYFVDPDREDYKLHDLSKEIRVDLKIPVYIQRAFDTLEQVVQNGSHGKQSKQDRLVVDRDVKNGIAPYLLRSCLFELLNIIMWLKMWLEAEKKLQQRQQEVMGEKIIGKRFLVWQGKNCLSVGEKCKLHKACMIKEDAHKPKVNIGDEVRIRDVMENDGYDKNEYPFIVTNIELYKNDTKSVLL